MSARRPLLALAVALAPLVQIAGVLPHPALPDTAAATLAVVAEDPAEWTRIHLLAATAALLSVVASLALADLVRGRGAGLATAGATLATVGGGVLALAFASEAHLHALAADPALDRAAMAELVQRFDTSSATTLLSAGFPLAGLGSVLLMSGLLRSRAVPRWQPALVLAGLVVSFGATPGLSYGPLLFVPAAVGQLALAVQVLRRREAAPVHPQADRVLQAA